MVDTTLQDKFMSICQSTIHRDGMEDLLAWLKQSDFFSAPASTRFHGNYQGGLLEHSINVYHALHELLKQHPQLTFTDETIAIVSLLHDLCKVNYYVTSTRNVKDEATGKWTKQPYYTTDDQFPVGHGEKSVIILMKYMKLTDEEIYAIRFHMGGFDSSVKGGDFSMSKAYDLCPLAVLLHLADMTATYLLEERNV